MEQVLPTIRYMQIIFACSVGAIIGIDCSSHFTWVIRLSFLGFVHIISHFKMDLYLSLSTSLNIHLIYSCLLFWSCIVTYLVENVCGDLSCEERIGLLVTKIILLLAFFFHFIVFADIFTERVKEFVKKRRDKNRVTPLDPISTISRQVQPEGTGPPGPKEYVR